jgi:hypothetical protein
MRRLARAREVGMVSRVTVATLWERVDEPVLRWVLSPPSLEMELYTLELREPKPVRRRSRPDVPGRAAVPSPASFRSPQTGSGAIVAATRDNNRLQLRTGRPRGERASAECPRPCPTHQFSRRRRDVVLGTHVCRDGIPLAFDRTQPLELGVEASGEHPSPMRSLHAMPAWTWSFSTSDGLATAWSTSTTAAERDQAAASDSTSGSGLCSGA